MRRVVAIDPPEASFLVQRAELGDYLDCFEVMMERPVDLPAFLFAFYTTPLFRLERLVLSAKLRRAITDAEVRALADGAETFAVWRVMDRDATQVLLQDTAWGTRSWFCVSQHASGTTVLRFGSRVAAQNGVLPPLARAILPVHVAYGRALLKAAARRLDRQKSAPNK